MSAAAGMSKAGLKVDTLDLPGIEGGEVETSELRAWVNTASRTLADIETVYAINERQLSEGSDLKLRYLMGYLSRETIATLVEPDINVCIAGLVRIGSDQNLPDDLSELRDLYFSRCPGPRAIRDFIQSHEPLTPEQVAEIRRTDVGLLPGTFVVTPDLTHLIRFGNARDTGDTGAQLSDAVVVFNPLTPANAGPASQIFNAWEEVSDIARNTSMRTLLVGQEPDDATVVRYAGSLPGLDIHPDIVVTTPDDMSVEQKYLESADYAEKALQELMQQGQTEVVFVSNYYAAFSAWGIKEAAQRLYEQYDHVFHITIIIHDSSNPDVRPGDEYVHSHRDGRFNWEAYEGMNQTDLITGEQNGPIVRTVFIRNDDVLKRGLVAVEKAPPAEMVLDTGLPLSRPALEAYEAAAQMTRSDAISYMFGGENRFTNVTEREKYELLSAVFTHQIDTPDTKCGFGTSWYVVSNDYFDPNVSWMIQEQKDHIVASTMTILCQQVRIARETGHPMFFTAYKGAFKNIIRPAIGSGDLSDVIMLDSLDQAQFKQDAGTAEGRRKYAGKVIVAETPYLGQKDMSVFARTYGVVIHRTAQANAEGEHAIAGANVIITTTPGADYMSTPRTDPYAEELGVAQITLGEQSGAEEELHDLMFRLLTDPAVAGKYAQRIREKHRDFYLFARLTIDQRNQILAGGGEAAARLRESQRSSFVGVLEHIIGVPGSRIEQTEDEQMALIEHLIERARRLNEKQFLEVRQQTYDTLSANAGLAELDSARLELVISGYAAMAVLQNPDAGTEASVIDDAA